MKRCRRNANGPLIWANVNYHKAGDMWDRTYGDDFRIYKKLNYPSEIKLFHQSSRARLEEFSLQAAAIEAQIAARVAAEKAEAAKKRAEEASERAQRYFAVGGRSLLND